MCLKRDALQVSCNGLRTGPEKLGVPGNIRRKVVGGSVRRCNTGRTEEGETGESHFIETTWCLSSDAESTVFEFFVVVLDFTDRCRASLMRNSNSSCPLVQFENLLSCASEA